MPFISAFIFNILIFMVAKITKRNETDKLSKDYFLSFCFFSGKWQEVTSIDSQKYIEKHRLSYLFLSLTTIWLSTHKVWWPSSDEPHQLFLLLCWKWLLMTITVPFSERCKRGYMGRLYLYIYIYNYIYINITFSLKFLSHFDKQLAEKGTVIVISNQ